MVCPKCGQNSIDGSTFCVNCGTNLKEMMVNNQPVDNNNYQNNFNNDGMNNNYVNPTINSSINQNQYNAQMYSQPVNNMNVATVTFSYISYIIAILLKPFRVYGEEKEKLSNTKVSAVLGLIVSGIMTLITLISSIVAFVRVPSYEYGKGMTYSWKWDNLKEFKWVDVIGKNFLLYAGTILAIAIVFYVASLIIKKQLKFNRSLAIVSTAFIPYAIGSMALAPILVKIWSPLYMIVSVVSLIYSVTILTSLMNSELDISGDQKIYFNLICYTIIIVGGYYAYLEIFPKLIISNSVNSLINILG